MKTATHTLVTGGCRSGKSRHALHLADNIKGLQKHFIATCMPGDDEMRMRVVNHQKERSKDWITVESPFELAEAVDTHGRDSDIILVDCLTLWVSNMLLKYGPAELFARYCPQLAASIQSAPCPVILVTNEVGTGVVPENKLARQFRDSAGYVNQCVAEVCDRVVWMVAGIPVTVKE